MLERCEGRYYLHYAINVIFTFVLVKSLLPVRDSHWIPAVLTSTSQEMMQHEVDVMQKTEAIES